MAVWKRLAALVSAMALLTGCGGFPPGDDVEEMLRAPQATQQQSAVQRQKEPAGCLEFIFSQLT